jgi:hypothetical protein
MTKFLQKLSAFQLLQTRRNIAKLPFLPKWVAFLFAADLDLEQVIEIWNWIMHAVGPKTFSDALACICAAIPVEMRSECEKGDTDELIGVLDDLSNLQVPLVLARAAQL